MAAFKAELELTHIHIRLKTRLEQCLNGYTYVFEIQLSNKAVKRLLHDQTGTNNSKSADAKPEIHTS